MPLLFGLAVCFLNGCKGYPLDAWSDWPQNAYMCGRFTITAPPAELATLLGVPVDSLPVLLPRYNVAPTQLVLAGRVGIDGTREAVMLRWGLMPAWADDPTISHKLINARADTVATKPSFRSAFKKRRCLIAADGFFEWKAEGKKKQPYLFRRADGNPFAFAGLWERWERAGGEPIETCALITTDANATVRPVHDRMPVILMGDAVAHWLAPGHLEVAEAASLLVPAPDDSLVVRVVNPVMNSPKVDDPRCIESTP